MQRKIRDVVAWHARRFLLKFLVVPEAADVAAVAGRGRGKDGLKQVTA